MKKLLPPKKIDKTYESIWIYPFYLNKELFSIELLKNLEWEIKPCIRPYSAYLKYKSKNGTDKKFK